MTFLLVKTFHLLFLCWEWMWIHETKESQTGDWRGLTTAHDIDIVSDETPISEVEKRGLNLGSVSERRNRDEIKAQDQQGTLKLWRSFWHRVTHSGPPPRAKSLTRKPRSIYCVQCTVYKKGDEVSYNHSICVVSDSPHNDPVENVLYVP